MADKLNLSIEYCTSWGYDKRAASLADELKRAFPGRVENVQLVKSSGGVFEIRNGDQLIFSKRQLGRFPEPGEVEKQLAA